MCHGFIYTTMIKSAMIVELTENIKKVKNFGFEWQ